MIWILIVSFIITGVDYNSSGFAANQLRFKTQELCEYHIEDYERMVVYELTRVHKMRGDSVTVEASGKCSIEGEDA